MKKSSVIFLAVFLVLILPLTFLTVKFFLNRNNPSEIKINLEKPEVELIENLILAPPIRDDLKEESNLAEPQKMVEETAKTEEKAEVKKAVEKSPPVALEVKNHLVSWGFTKSTQRNIDTIIIHSSYDALSKSPYGLEGLIKEYQQYEVAPHYLIDRGGVIYRLVADKNVAYHAGASQTPDGRKNVNDFSLGIEIMTTKTDSPTQDQYSALQKLVDFLKESYKIKYVLGHNQIAPERKDDPWNFDWKKIK